MPPNATVLTVPVKLNVASVPAQSHSLVNFTTEPWTDPVTGLTGAARAKTKNSFSGNGPCGAFGQVGQGHRAARIGRDVVESAVPG